MRIATHPRAPWITEPPGQLDSFRDLIQQRADAADYPLAARIEHNVPLYDLPGHPRRALQGELIRALLDGPGVVVLRGAFTADVIDRATGAFEQIIAAQRQAGTAAGDHFGAPGGNDRIWNAAEKLAVHAPDVFAEYYSNDALALVSQAWLGPVYQVTSQVNVVNPGAAAQVPHRDYHLGFLGAEQLRQYPAHTHRLSPALTLQGAVAHCDMPLASGPTMLLPFSQLFEPGYLAFRRPEFLDLFARTNVQLPLRKGDAVFFNPALFHGAGANTSPAIKRMANLLQVSSPFGRAMEKVDRTRMCLAVLPALQQLRARGTAENLLRNTVVATAEGYPFPADLDVDQPIDGLAPPAQTELLWQAVTEGWTVDALAARLTA